MTDALVLNLHKSQVAAATAVRSLVIQMGGTDVASARWSIATETVPAWLFIPQTDGFLAAANSSTQVFGTISSALVAAEDYGATVAVTVVSQVLSRAYTGF